MNRFLVLSKRIINTKYIQDIIVEENLYIINLSSRPNLTGFLVYGCGFISNDSSDKIYIKQYGVNEIENLDYNKVSKYIQFIGYDIKNEDKTDSNKINLTPFLI